MNDITIWDQIAATYDEHTYEEKDGAYPANRYRADRLIDFLKTLPVGSILDAGGGTGYVAARVAELGWRVSYYDASAEMLRVAQEATRGQLADYQQGSITDMGVFADQSFDVVMMNGVLPYLSESEEPNAYQEMQRVLKPGGYFIAAQYNQFFDLLECNYFTAEMIAQATEALSPEDAAHRLSNLLPAATDKQTRSMKTENPLTYTNKLQSLGFTEKKRHYYNFHILPVELETVADNPLRAQFELAHHADWQGVLFARAFFVIAQKSE